MTALELRPAEPRNEVEEIASAVALLALPKDNSDQRWNITSVTAAWLLSKKSTKTRRAYFTDIAQFLAWCEAAGLDPRHAQRADVDTYAASITRQSDLKPSSVARHLSSISSWYAYQMSNGTAPANPAAAVDRPNVDRDSSSTTGLSSAEITQFMRAARKLRSYRDRAILAIMAELGLRVGEALGLNLEDIRWNRGHRTVKVHGKGGKVRELPIPVPLGRDLDAWLEVRAGKPGPLFTTRSGRAVGQKEVFLLVRKVGKMAGLPSWEELSPHSLRHSVATASLDAGAPLRDVQDLLGHADPRTTRRYDRSRGSLDRSPAYIIAGLFSDDVVEA